MKILLLLIPLLFFISCEEGGRSHTGELGEKCYPDDRCDEGLRCVEGVKGKFCEDPCSGISCSGFGSCFVGKTNLNPYCNCEKGYNSVGTECILNCSDKKNSKPNDANNFCICEEGYLDNGKHCIRDCSEFLNSHEENYECVCNDGFELEAIYKDSCILTTSYDKCINDDICTNSYKCHAGYCSELKPKGGQFFDVKLIDKTSGEALTCDQTLVEKVKVSIYRDDFLLKDDDVNGFSYSYEFACKDILTQDIEGSIKYFYIGGNKHLKEHQLNAGKGPLQVNRSYKVKFEFLRGDGDVLDTQNIEVTANTLTDPTLPKAVESVSAKLDKVTAKPLRVKWSLVKGITEYTSGSDEICFKNDAEHRDNIMSFYVRLVKKYYNLDPICDANTNCNFQNIDLVSCNDTDAWNLDFMVNEATDYVLEVYATDTSKNVMYQKTIEFDIPQADFDNASETDPMLIPLQLDKVQ